MKQTLSTTEAADILLQDDNANWTRRGSLRLIEWYEALEEDFAEDGEQMELDCTSIRCEWTEYDLKTLLLDFDYLIDDEEVIEESDKLSIILQELNERTTVIEVEQYSEPNTYLVQAF